MSDQNRVSNQENILVEVSIEQAKIVTTAGEEFEIDVSSISELNIFESLQYPGITGEFTLQDWQGLKEHGEIFAGDKIHFVWSTEGSKTRFQKDLEYIIYAAGEDDYSKRDYNLVSYKFCSPWLIEAFSRQVSKAWENQTPDQMVRDLFGECGLDFFYVEGCPDSQKINFVSPLWSPMHTIKYLTKFMVDEEGRGGYIVWTDFMEDLVYCIPIGMLLNDEIWNGSSEARRDLPYTLNPNNTRYINGIHQMKMESSFDVMKFSNLGLARGNLIGFNFDKTSIVETNITGSSHEHLHLSTTAPIPKSFDDESYESKRFSTLFPNTLSREKTGQKIKTLLEGKVKYDYSLLSADLFKVVLQVNPDSERRVGSLIHLIVPGVPSENNSDLFTGTYLIRDIRHTIVGGSSYQQFITVVSDGYKKIKRNDLVGW